MTAPLVPEGWASVEDADDGLIAIDADGVVVGWDDHAHAILGWLREEALGQPLTATIAAPTQVRALTGPLRAHRPRHHRAAVAGYGPGRQQPPAAGHGGVRRGLPGAHPRLHGRRRPSPRRRATLVGICPTRPTACTASPPTTSSCAPSSWRTPLRERAFERFVTVGDHGGSGLGLPIARSLARAHGGDADYRNDAFVLRLPVAADQTGGATGP